ncbi:MAG TPA: chorismate mutase [Acetobacteraceae bacterium]|nr:chorismate mutase [Acetobacteraceae bacterium]
MSDPSLHTASVPSDLAAHRLAALRAELDRIDDALHDTLMRRAEVVAQVGALGAKGRVPLRPGREAAIIRRLLARHRGGMAAASVVRIWRELLAGFTSQQVPMLITVCEPDEGPSLMAVAREHFGALTPVSARRTPAQAIRDVSSGLATAAVLPVPAEGEPAAQAWWTALLQRDDPRIHVVARLPIWAKRPEGTPQGEAMVVTAAAPDPSGDDRSLIGLEVTLETSRARLMTELAAADLKAEPLILRRDPGAPFARALADVAGFVADADPRLSQLQSVLHPPIVLGAYAIPVGEPA